MADVEILGLEDLGRRVHELTAKLERQAIRKAARAGANVFREQMKLRAPVRESGGPKGKTKRMPGFLRKHIALKFSLDHQGGVNVDVGPTKGAFYARFYEMGTAHQPARPFMRPAFDTKVKAAEDAFAETLKAEIAEFLA